MFGFFETITDFTKRDTITIEKTSIFLDKNIIELNNIQSVPILNTGINYFLKNKSMTNNILCFAQSFNVTSELDISNISAWFLSNYKNKVIISEIEYPKNMNNIKDTLLKNELLILKFSASFYVGLIMYNYKINTDFSEDDSDFSEDDY